MQNSFSMISSGNNTEKFPFLPIENDQSNESTCVNLYQCDNKIFYVPESFEFIKMNIRDVMLFWYLGQTVSNDSSMVVKPFREFKSLPKRPKDKHEIQ